MATASGTAGGRPPDKGARSALEHGWQTFKDRFWILLGISIVAYLLQAVGPGLQTVVATSGAHPLVGSGVGMAWALLVGTPVGAGLQYAYLRAARGEAPEVGDLLAGFPRLLSLVGASLLTGAIVLVGFVLLVIPGIYAALRLAFVPLLIVDKDLDAVDGVKRCWDRMGGNVLDLFLFALASAVIAVVGLLLLIVGIVPAGVWILSSFAAFYRAVFEEGEPTPAAGGSPEDPVHVPEAEPVGAS